MTESALVELSGGIDPLVLVGGGLRVEVQPSVGAQVVSITSTTTQASPNILFHEPWAHGSVPDDASGDASMLEWVSTYSGGWQELFPNAGEACIVGGLTLPFHGEVSRMGWDVVGRGPRWATLRSTARLPLRIERRMTVEHDRPVLRIEEEVSLVSHTPHSFCWGHHPAFDAPPGSTLDLPEAEVWADQHMLAHADYKPGSVGTWPHLPRAGGGDPVDLRLVPARPAERLCYIRPASAWSAIRDSASGYGVALAWDLATFPFLWLWQQIGGGGFPWFGRTRITAIEPQTSWPADGLAEAIERGHAHTLWPGERRATWLTLSLFDADDRPVCGVDRDGAVLRASLT